MRTYPALIVGAGSAGLAAAACLRGAGIDNVVLEAGTQPGMRWSGHYERLHLHTDARRSALPGLAFPHDAGRYPSRDHVVEYLAAYTRHHQLQVVYDTHVRRVLRRHGAWQVESDDGKQWLADNLIVATGLAAHPFIPEWKGRAGFVGPILHSADYKNGRPFSGQRVLVVGFGNSAGEIAVDLHEHGASATLAVRGPVNITGKELLGIPVLAFTQVLSRVPPRLADAVVGPINRMRFRYATRRGLRFNSLGPFRQMREQGRIPLIDVGTMALIRSGDIAVRPGIDSLDGTGVEFVDGSTGVFDAIVAATGYRADCATLFADADRADLFDERGLPKDESPPQFPGLYFTGFEVSPGGMLPAAGRRARRVAADVLAARTEGGAGGRSQ